MTAKLDTHSIQILPMLRWHKFLRNGLDTLSVEISKTKFIRFNADFSVNTNSQRNRGIVSFIKSCAVQFLRIELAKEKQRTLRAMLVVKDDSVF